MDWNLCSRVKNVISLYIVYYSCVNLTQQPNCQIHYFLSWFSPVVWFLFNSLHAFSTLYLHNTTLLWFTFFSQFFHGFFSDHCLQIDISQGSMMSHFSFLLCSESLSTSICSSISTGSALICIPVTLWNLCHQPRILPVYQINLFSFNPKNAYWQVSVWL